MQTKSFEANKEIVFSSVVSVLQDLGYIIKGADIKTGFINAQSATKDTSGILSKMFDGDSSNSRTNVTAFVENRGNSTSVRLNFVVSNTASSAYGQASQNDQIIHDASVYENAFNKIGDTVFIKNGN